MIELIIIVSAGVMGSCFICLIQFIHSNEADKRREEWAKYWNDMEAAEEAEKND